MQKIPAVHSRSAACVRMGTNIRESVLKRPSHVTRDCEEPLGPLHVLSFGLLLLLMLVMKMNIQESKSFKSPTREVTSL